jgi:hypothetical protein
MFHTKWLSESENQPHSKKKRKSAGPCNNHECVFPLELEIVLHDVGPFVRPVVYSHIPIGQKGNLKVYVHLYSFT